jgi:hypothetical protein
MRLQAAVCDWQLLEYTSRAVHISNARGTELLHIAPRALDIDDWILYKIPPITWILEIKVGGWF